MGLAPRSSHWGGKLIFMWEFVSIPSQVDCLGGSHPYLPRETPQSPRTISPLTRKPPLPAGLGWKKTTTTFCPPRTQLWLGAGVIVVPGVTIGDDTMIGAGSVVTKDIPANVVAVGNPCHVLRPISEHDKEYFYRDRKINWETL